MSSDAKESNLNNSSSIDTSNISNIMISRDVGANKDFAKRHEEEKSETLKDGIRTSGNIIGISSEAAKVPNDEQKNNDSESGDNNNNSAQRATKVICRQIDSERLKKSGLHLQIAQAILKKAMQKPHNAEHYSIRQHEQNEKATTIHLDTSTTSTNKNSFEGGVTITEKKAAMLTSLPSSASTGGLSVPKITITSPPCDTRSEMLKDSKNNRLEDVKRILNRQILMRKLSNPAGSAVSMPLESFKERPEIEKTTLQLPPQTIIKSIKRFESTNATMSSTVSTTKTNNNTSGTSTKMPPVITVRKFHAIAAPQVIIKPITSNCTISSGTSQQKTNPYPMVNIVADKNMTSTVRVLTKQGFQTMPTTQKSPSNKLTFRHSSSIPILSRRVVLSTATSPTEIETIPKHFIASVSKGQDTISHQPPREVESPKSSSLSSSLSDMSSHTHTHISSATTSSRYKVLHTISTSKPKIFEIHCPKRLKEEEEAEEEEGAEAAEAEEEEEGHKEQKKTKSNYELKSKRLRLSEGISTVSTIPLKAPPNVTFCPSVSFEAPKVTVGRIIKIPKQKSIETEDERTKILDPINSKCMIKTENLPIVLENKLLQPDEQIDLKGLCLNRTKLPDGHSIISQKQQQQLSFNSNRNNNGKQTTFPPQKCDSNPKSLENRKMHIIISNEKLKSRKFDMAALAKQVLQRATKRISRDDDDADQSSKHKPKIPKASIDLLKKESICPSPMSPQKAILRRKILDLCGIQDDAYLSPVREYPKTVEIFEECDTSEYDDEGPTAVDFIASLALSGFGKELSSTEAAVNHYGVQAQLEIQTNANEISEEVEQEKGSLGAVGAHEVNHYGVQPQPEIQTKITGEAEQEKESLGAVGADEGNHYGVQPQPKIQTNANEITGEAELEKESLGAVGADEGNHYGVQLQPKIQTNANEITGEAELEKESLGAVCADEGNHSGVQPQPKIQTNANEITGEAELEKESLGAVGADEGNHYGVQPQPKIQTNANEIMGEAELEKESLGAVGADEGNNCGVKPQPEIQTNANEITGEAELENDSLGAVGADEDNHYGVQPQPKILPNANEITEEAELGNKYLGAVGADEENHYGVQPQPEVLIIANEISGEVDLAKDSLGAVGADEVNHYGVQPQPEIQTNANEISKEAEQKKESVGDGAVKELINTIGKRLCNEETVGQDNDQIKTVNEYETKVYATKEEEEKTVEKLLDSCENCEASVEERRSPIESNLENIQKISSIIETTSIVAATDENLTTQDNPESSFKHQTKNENESKSLIDDDMAMKEISAGLMEKIAIENRKVDNSREKKASEKNQDVFETDKRSEVTDDNTSATKNIARKRIGIRNAPINLIARKKPTIKKPIKSQKSQSEQSKTRPETNESVIVAEAEKSSSLEGRGDERILYTEESFASNQSQQKILVESLEPSPKSNINEDDNMGTRKIEDVNSVTENKSNPTDILVISTDSSKTPPISSNLPKECEIEYIQKQMEEINPSTDKRDTTFEDIRTETKCQRTESRNNKDECKKIEEETHGIVEILASFPIATDPPQSNHTTSSSTQAALLEVGAIIDMKAYGIEQVLKEKIGTKVTETLSTMCDKELRNSKLQHLDENDNDNGHSDDSQIGLKSSRKHLRRKKRICRILSSSESERETNEPIESYSNESLNLKTFPLNDECISSTSNGSDLFGFAMQHQTEFREEENEEVKKIEDDCANTMESISSSTTTTKVVSKLYADKTYPFVKSTGSRGNNIPLKKRWELTNSNSNKHKTTSYDNEIDIIDDPSPDNDDTMDNQDIANKSNHDDDGAQREEKLIENRSIHFDLIMESVSKETSTPLAEEKSKNDINSIQEINNTSKSNSVVVIVPSNLSIKTEETPTELSKLSGKATSRKCSSRTNKRILSDSEGDEIKLQTEDGDLLSIPITSTPIPKRRRGREPKKVKIVDTQAACSLESFELKSKDDSISGLDRLDTNTVLKKTKGHKAKSSSSLKVLEKPKCSIDNEEPSVTAEHQMPITRRRSSRKIKQTEQCSTKEVKKSQTEQCSTKEVKKSQTEQCSAKEVKKSQTEQCSTKEVKKSQTDDVAVAVKRPTEETVNANAIDETKITKKRGRKKQIPAAAPPSQEKSNIDETMQLEDSATIDTANDKVIVTKKKCGRKPMKKCLSSVIQQSITEENPESITTTPVIPKKRGRKPRVITMTTTTDIETQKEGDTAQDVNINQKIEAPKKKRQSIVGDFNPRFLLIRQREQLDTEEVLTVDENERGNGPLQCGLCLARTTESNWQKHLGEHYGIGWIVDKEPAIDITTRSTILSRIIAYFKQIGKQATLPCRICARYYKSPLGLLLHMEQCGDTIRVECPFCEQKYTKLSYIVHQRTCLKAKKCDANDDEEKVSNAANESVLSNTGRLKRAAQIRAETKLKNLTTELSNEAKFEPKDFIKCRENETGGAEFHCTECNSSFQTEEDAIGHVLQYHKSKENPIRNLDADGSDYDGNNEVDLENRASTTESDVSSMESDSDDLASTSIKLKVGKNKIEPKRAGSSGLPMVYPQRVRDVPKLVLRKWNQFIGSNYTTNMLYPYAMPIYSDEEQQQSRDKEQISSTEFDSMMFAFSDSEMHFKPLGGSSKNNQDWQKLRRFESMDQRSTDKLVCLGSPIKVLAWVPLTDDIPEQYLVVSCRKSFNSFTRHSKPKSEDALLFIYKIEEASSSINDSEMSNEGGFSAKIHYILQIRNGPVHTMAFLPSGGYDAAVNRLGLLAIGTATSDIEIFALPIQPEKFDEMKIEVIDETVRVLSLMPAFKLVLDASSTEASIGGHPLNGTQCSHICWSEFSGHQHIFSSYVHGYIAIWDIKEPADSFYNLNCHMQAGIRLFTPLNYFYFGEKIINSFAVHYDTNGARWLAVMGSARKHIVYDIRNLTNPITLKEEFLRNVPRDVDWSPIWEPYTAAFCDAIPNHGHVVLAISPVSIIYTHTRMEYMLCGVSTVHYNPWQCVYCVGVDNGDILYINTREMHHDLQVLLRTNSNVMAVSELDIKRLDGEEIVGIKSNGNPTNWRMYENDYKEKYGLVFTNVTKFKTSDRKAYLSEQRIPPRNMERYMRISTVRWNLNAFGKHYVAIGYDNGFLRLMRFNREAYFE